MPRIHRVYGYVFSTFPLGTLSFLKRGLGVPPKNPIFSLALRNLSNLTLIFNSRACAPSTSV